MGDKLTITLVAQPQDFFRELITEAMSRQKVTTQPETEFYLVNLLNQFMTTDRLYTVDSNGGIKDEPLVVMLKDALEQSSVQQQRALFRHVGDVSLYTAGFFQDSLNRKKIEVPYYVEMGGVAYQNVAARAEDQQMRVLYQELADRFSSWVDVLAEVSDQAFSHRTEKDLLRLYDQWLRTGSERAARALQEAGIVPNDTVKKDWQ